MENSVSPPIKLGGLDPEDANDRGKMQTVAAEFRSKMQSIINAEVQKRRYVYFSNQPLLTQSA